MKDNPFGNEQDWAMLHYATGILMGLADKYGVIDVTIYHDDVKVLITSGAKRNAKGKPSIDRRTQAARRGR